VRLVGLLERATGVERHFGPVDKGRVPDVDSLCGGGRGRPPSQRELHPRAEPHSRGEKKEQNN